MGDLRSLSGRRVYLDANIFIYAFESLQPWCEIAQEILLVAQKGELHPVTSELTLAECLVKPLSMNQTRNTEIYLQAIRQSLILDVIPIHRSILIEAANFRAATGCRLPDAIHLATAKTNQCDIFITNDRDIKKNAPEQVVLLPELT